MDTFTTNIKGEITTCHYITSFYRQLKYTHHILISLKMQLKEQRLQTVAINNRVVELDQKYSFSPALTQNIALSSGSSANAIIAYQDMSVSGYGYLNKVNL